MWAPLNDGNDFLACALIAAILAGIMGYVMYGDAVREVICQISR